MSGKPDLAKREAWQRRLRRFDRGTLSVGEFCWREEVSVASFYQWRRKLRGDGGSPAAREENAAARRPTPPSGFIPVEITGLPAATACVEVLLPGGPRLRIPCRESQAIRTVVAALTAASADLLAVSEAEDRRC